jgi:hypothetical protein
MAQQIVWIGRLDMDSNAQGHPRSIFRRVPKLAYAGLLLAVALLYFLAWRPELPGLTSCTRIEIHYPYGGLGYFFHDTPIQKGILTHEEEEYAKACETWAVEDQEMIRTFAHDISQATYQGRVRDHPPASSVSLACYSGAERIASFTIFSNDVVTQDGLQFKCPPSLPNLRLLEPPRIRIIRPRYVCATQLRGLYAAGFSRPREAPSYPEADHWCDMVVETLRKEYRIELDKGGVRRRSYSDAAIGKMLMCPTAQRPSPVQSAPGQADEAEQSLGSPCPWQSDYAMNPNCREDSPKDMVFLFESKPGWNQHGGPELFTFDNHDPKGGLVLLNGGDMKFIRTKEELKQLRWK